ncbi:MAG: MFS transporter [Gammaproteobacteria bacterium]|nr:MFS transporter [Gammaproteobacteria bacterium]
MSSHERRVVLSLMSIYFARMIGLFLLFPVLILFVEEYDFPAYWMAASVIGLYGLTQALMQIPMGWLSDRIGRRPVLLIGLALLFSGAIIAALSDSAWGLIIGRLIQGCGATSAVAMAIVADEISPANRIKATALIGICIGVSFALAMLLSPLLAGIFSGLSSVFILSAVLALIAASLVMTLPSSRRLKAQPAHPEQSASATQASSAAQQSTAKQPAQADQSARAAQPSNPAHPEHPAHPEQSASATQASSAAQRSTAKQPAQADQTAPLTQSALAKKSASVVHTDQANHTAQTEQSVQANHADQVEQSVQARHAAQVEQTAQAGPRGQTEQPVPGARGRRWLLCAGVFILHASLSAVFLAVPARLAAAGVATVHHGWFYFLALAVIAPVLAVRIRVARRSRADNSVAVPADASLALALAWLALAWFAPTLAAGTDSITSLVFLAAMTVVYLYGFTVLEAVLPAAYMSLADPSRRGTMMGMFSSCQFLGSFAGGVAAGVGGQFNSILAVHLVGLTALALWAWMASRPIVLVPKSSPHS